MFFWPLQALAVTIAPLLLVPLPAEDVAALPDAVPVVEEGTPAAMVNVQPSQKVVKKPAEKPVVVPTIPPGNGAKIAIVIDDMGVNRKYSKLAAQLPGPMTLAYIPYAKDVASQSNYGRSHGHRLMVHLPMEPRGKQDPGPKALFTAMDEPTIKATVRWNLSQFDGFIGVNNHMGSKLTSNQQSMNWVMEELGTWNLFFLNSKTTGSKAARNAANQHGVRYVERDVFIDHENTPAYIQRQLAQTLRVARRKGHVIAIGHPRKHTVNALRNWLPRVKKAGYRLVPVRALLPAKPAQVVHADQ